MNLNDYFVIFGCSLFGYFVVAWLLKDKFPVSSSRSNESSQDEADEDDYKESHYENSESCDDDDISKNWFTVLGVSEHASKEEIAKAYKKVISQYHPDKVACLGVEIREVAEVTTKKINAAYSYAKGL